MTDQVQGFDHFVGACGPALLRFAYLLTGNRSLAEDLVQDALIKAHRRWSVHGRVDFPEAYVRRIVVNEFLSWRRRRASREVVGPVPEQAHRDEFQPLVERDAVWRVLAELPRRQRSVLVLRYYEAMPDGEIAMLLGCAEGTVRSLATRAFATLRCDSRLGPHLDSVAVRE